MWTYVFQRAIAMLVTMFVVATITFVITGLIPGSPAAVMLGEEATIESIRELDRQLGMDRPIIVRYVTWLGGLLRGDLGFSIYQQNVRVQTLVLSRAEPTILIATSALVIAVLIGLPLGIIAAVNHRKAADGASMVIALAGISIPNFWLGLNLILIFGLALRWLPTSGYVSLSDDPTRTWRYIILPAITLGTSHAAFIARMARANLLEVLRTDYVRTARAKGLRNRAVIIKHAMRNAMVPTLSVIGVAATLMVGGSVVTETVFAIPGIGRMMLESVLRRDFPLLQGLIILVALSVAMINFIVDILYGVFNPTIRYA
jgi:peptide/nickel transport system permease protein